MESIIKLIAIIFSGLIAARQMYWWQVKEYRFDRWWSWVRYNDGWKELLQFSWRRPKLTLRVLAVILVWLISVLVTDWPVILLMGYLAPIIGFGLTWPMHEIGKYWLMSKAKERLKKYNPIVIGITGSYGKSSSKEFLAETLSQKYEVLKTLKNQNTEIAIAKRILTGLTEKIQIVILEIGAYKQGEIARVCKMAPLDIAWVTVIGNQHVDLFGDLEKLKKAKMELVEGLKPNGKAFFGFDSAPQIAKSLGIEKPIDFKPEINIIATPSGIKVIDKSYSTNQAAFERDIDILKKIPGKRKFVITPGIIELGKYTQEVHEQITKKFAGLDEVWVTSNWARKYLHGQEPKNIDKVLKDGDVLLIEGRIPSGLKQKLINL